MTYLGLKFIHILGAIFLFGTGLGSAFYMYRADRHREIHAIYFAAKNVVIADWLFTTPTIIIMPLTGLAMTYLVGYPLTHAWIAGSLALYVLAGACWLPVVYLQIRMRDMAFEALARQTALPPLYHRYMRIWFWLGVPAFAAMVVIIHLMVFKPTG
jgi:uncharacterized membrane protein